VPTDFPVKRHVFSKHGIWVPNSESLEKKKTEISASKIRRIKSKVRGIDLCQFLSALELGLGSRTAGPCRKPIANKKIIQKHFGLMGIILRAIRSHSHALLAESKVWWEQ